MFGLNKLRTDSDVHFGGDAVKEKVHSGDRVIQVKVEKHVEFRVGWRIVKC